MVREMFASTEQQFPFYLGKNFFINIFKPRNEKYVFIWLLDVHFVFGFFPDLILSVVDWKTA